MFGQQRAAAQPGGGGLSSDISNSGTNQPAQHGVDVCQQTGEAQRCFACGQTNRRVDALKKHIWDTNRYFLTDVHVLEQKEIHKTKLSLGSNTTSTNVGFKDKLLWILPGNRDKLPYCSWSCDWSQFCLSNWMFPFLCLVWRFGSLIVLILSFLFLKKKGQLVVAAGALWWPSVCFQSADATFLDLSEPLNCKSVLKSAIKTGHF